MSKRAVNHHIVPEVLQRSFAVESDAKRIWRCKRTSKGQYNAPTKKLIDKSFVVRNYYTTLENDKRSDRIEREFYGPIDDFLGRLLPEVIGIIERGEVPSFSVDALKSLQTVVLQMLKRTPDFLKDHDDTRYGRQVIENTLNDLPSDAPLEHSRMLKAALQDNEVLRDQGRHIRVRATLEDSPLVTDALSEFVPRWSISNTKHSYILSSMMVYRIGNGGPNGLSNPKMEMWMPIGPKVSMVLVRDPYNKIPYKVIDTPEHIRKVNEYAVANSFEIASHSEALIKSLIASKF
jgi:hypothetical protein